MIYRFGESRIEAETAEELVTKLRHASPWDEARTDAQWMKIFSDRQVQDRGKAIRTGSVGEFIEDLITIGLLTVEV